MAKILIVDDHAVNREFLITLLGYKKHSLFEANDGAEALEVVRAERPDLVITDILMPTMDGYEFVRQLREDPKIAATAVIFYTAHYHKQEARQLAKNCGVAHILVKPCEPELILKIVNESLGNPLQITAPLTAERFDNEHLRVMTDKLSQTTDELSGANQRLDTLIEISLQLASERDPRQLLNKVCRAARDLLGANYAVLSVGSRDEGKDVYFSISGIDAISAGRLARPALREGIFGGVFAERKSRRVTNSQGDPKAVGLPAGYPPAHALLVAPIVSLAHTYGWICLANKVGADEFSAEDERLLTILAAQVGRIYENGSLYTEIQKYAKELETEILQRQQAQEKVERLNRVYAVLSGINTLIVRVRDRQELFNEACRIAVEHGGFGMAWIGAYDPSTHEITPVAWAGVDASVIADGKRNTRVNTRGSPGVSSRAIVEKKVVFSNNLTSEPGIGGPGRKEGIARGYRSLIALPLLVGGNAVGNLSLFAREENFFNDDELKLLNELAGDISFALEHIGKEERLNYLAYYDELTGLPNRTLLQDYLGRVVRRAKEEGFKAAMVECDVKRFSHINETLGRKSGDALLRAIGQRLKQIWPEPDNMGRLSADCFGGIVASFKDASEIAQLIEGPIAKALSESFEVDGEKLRISVTTGIAIFPDDGDNTDALFKNAEAALKKAKAGGEKYLFYHAKMNAAVTETLRLENNLRRAIDKEEFVLHYQPKLNLASGHISGLEALIRWNDPESGLVPPGKFIPLLEETGMILDVGIWAIRKALHDYREWYVQGLQPPRIAVNVSLIQLRQKNFVETVSKAIKDSKAMPHGLDLEITESLIMEDVEGNIKKLKALRDMGINIAIDDFGTGYSSLGYLARLPVNLLKIDRSFIITMTKDADSMAIVSTIISLAHLLSMKVIAEGVETEEQQRFLKLLKCDEMQGYLFSKPLPLEQLTKMLEELREK